MWLMNIHIIKVSYCNKQWVNEIFININILLPFSGDCGSLSEGGGAGSVVETAFTRYSSNRSTMRRLPIQHARYRILWPDKSCWLMSNGMSYFQLPVLSLNEMRMSSGNLYLSRNSRTVAWPLKQAACNGNHFSTVCTLISSGNFFNKISTISRFPLYAVG